MTTWSGTYFREKCLLKRWYHVFGMLKKSETRKNKLKLGFKLLPKIFCRRNNIHWEIDQWNRRRFDAKWHVTVPYSVTSIKPVVCKWIYTSRGWYCQNDTRITRILNFHPHFHKIVIWIIFLSNSWRKMQFFCRLVQPELNVSYETSIFRSMFLLH